MNRVNSLANATNLVVATIVFALALAGPALAQVDCPLVAAGGGMYSDGTMVTIGDVGIGVLHGGEDVNQGALPCWLLVDECREDIDGNGSVDLPDLSTVLTNFGTASGATHEQGDVNGDGDVDLADLASLLSVFGSTCP